MSGSTAGDSPTTGGPAASGGPAAEVDARGQRCPLPVIALARAARTVAAGTEVVLVATDPATLLDVPAWCRMRGHTLLSSPAIKEFPSRDQGIRDTPPADVELRFVVRVEGGQRPQPAPPPGSP